MVKLVSSSSRADEQTLFSETREVFRLEFPRKVVTRKLALAEAGELMYELEFFPAELRDIGTEFLAAYLIEYRGPNSFEFL